VVEHTMDVSSWLRKQLEQTSPDLLRAMVQEWHSSSRSTTGLTALMPENSRPSLPTRSCCPSRRHVCLPCRKSSRSDGPLE
jgi:hypothetical protein